MTQQATYPPKNIGSISRPTPEERMREGDRWVTLRTLRSTPVPAAPAESETVPVTGTRALFHAIDQRHAEARRKLQHPH